MTDTKKTPAAERLAPKTVKAPQDRKPSAQQIARDRKKREEEARNYLSSGLDFTPFEVDAGDGMVWRFQADVSPRSAEELRRAALVIEQVNQLTDEEKAETDIAALFAPLEEALRNQLVDEEQRAQFPLPAYGIRALGWFATVVQVGKTGFPTSAD